MGFYLIVAYTKKCPNDLWYVLSSNWTQKQTQTRLEGEKFEGEQRRWVAEADWG